MKKYCLILLALVSLITSCKDDTKTQETSKPQDITKAFNAMLDDYYEEGLKLNPLQATFAGDNRYNDKFPNLLSDNYTIRKKAYYVKYLNQLNQFPDSVLSPSEKMTRDILAWECSINLDGYQFSQDLTPIDQMWSPHLLVGQLASGASAQPFKTIEDYSNWLLRLDGYYAWLNSAESKMRKGIELGYVLPKSLIKKVLPQLKAGAEKDLDKHLFYTPIKNFPDTFSDEDRKTITDFYTRKLNNRIIPAYQSLYDFMSTEYMAAGRESSGISDIPNGEAYYKYMIKLFTTTNMTAEEIHQLGLDEVARISSEMEKVKIQVGFKGTLKEFFNHVRSNKELMPYTDPQQVIDNFNAIHERMKPQIEKLFDKKPKTKFEVRRTEAFRENSASAEYNPGSKDGTRPGIFYTPIPDVTQYNVHQDETLFLHEAIPRKY